MTEKQKDLIYQLANTIMELCEQCEQDENFHSVMIENNDLFTMSLDEWAFEWYAVANGERGE